MRALSGLMGAVLGTLVVLAFMVGYQAGTDEPDKISFPACLSDDGTPPRGESSCEWNASIQGNRAGDSFINFNGKIFLDNTQR